MVDPNMVAQLAEQQMMLMMQMGGPAAKTKAGKPQKAASAPGGRKRDSDHINATRFGSMAATSSDFQTLRSCTALQDESIQIPMMLRTMFCAASS